jgi:hypothetical protein
VLLVRRPITALENSSLEGGAELKARWWVFERTPLSPINRDTPLKRRVVKFIFLRPKHLFGNEGKS